MTAKSLKVGMFAALALVSAAGFAGAGERFSGRHEYMRAGHGSGYKAGGGHDFNSGHRDRDRFAQDGRRDRKQGFHGSRDVVGGDGLPSIVGGVGTFAGGISAVRLKGNGIYFASNVDIGGTPRTSFEVPQVKIITVGEDFSDTQFDAHDACAYENGVCIIRGGH
jgi:hypothetical protein